MPNEKIPCPSCTWRGPVWLDENRYCIYCCTTIPAGNNNYEWCWNVSPVGWWLEDGMIKADDIPAKFRPEVNNV